MVQVEEGETKSPATDRSPVLRFHSIQHNHYLNHVKYSFSVVTRNDFFFFPLTHLLVILQKGLKNILEHKSR